MNYLLNSLGFSTDIIIFVTVLSALTFLSSLIFLPWLILAIPEDYFVEKKHQPLNEKPRSTALRLIVLPIKNLLGIILFIMGLAMLLLPGQGILTILAGLILMDFPGKFLLLRNLARRKRVLKSLNWVRRKGKKAPFVT